MDGGLRRLNNQVEIRAGEPPQAVPPLKTVHLVGAAHLLILLLLLQVTGEPVAAHQHKAVPEVGATQLAEGDLGELLLPLLPQGPAGVQEPLLPQPQQDLAGVLEPQPVQAGARKHLQAVVAQKEADEEAEEVDVAASSVGKRDICLGNAQSLEQLVGEEKAVSNVEKKAICLESVQKVALEEVEEKAVSNVGKKAICLANVPKVAQQVGEERTVSSVGKKATCPVNVQKEVEMPVLTAGKKDTCRRTAQRRGNLEDEVEVAVEVEGKLTAQEDPQAGAALEQRQEVGEALGLQQEEAGEAAAPLRLKDKAAGEEQHLRVAGNLLGVLPVPVGGLMHGEQLLKALLLAVTLGVLLPPAQLHLQHPQRHLTHGELHRVKALQLEAILGARLHRPQLLPLPLAKPQVLLMHGALLLLLPQLLHPLILGEPQPRPLRQANLLSQQAGVHLKARPM